LKDKFCMQPWASFECDSGYVKACCWTPDCGFGVLNPAELRAPWNLPPLLEVRKSILDGSFKYCDKKMCLFMNRNQLRNRTDPVVKRIIGENTAEISGHPERINFSLDPSCNISCPQCREKIIKITPCGADKRLYDFNKKIFDSIIAATIGTKKYLEYTFCGTGEPFASALFRDFLFGADLRKKPNIVIGLHTNGLLLTPACFARMEKIRRNLKYIAISIDAATERTYGMVRRGGDWKRLMANLRHLAEQKRKGAIHAAIRLDFIVQKNNYREMADAVRLARSLDCRILFQPIRPTYKGVYFKDQLIWEKGHPLRPDLLRTLKDPVFAGDDVELSSAVLPSADKVQGRALAGILEKAAGSWSGSVEAGGVMRGFSLRLEKKGRTLRGYFSVPAGKTFLRGRVCAGWDGGRYAARAEVRSRPPRNFSVSAYPAGPNMLEIRSDLYNGTLLFTKNSSGCEFQLCSSASRLAGRLARKPELTL